MTPEGDVFGIGSNLGMALGGRSGRERSGIVGITV